jgi:predicted DCC family thiol-disulfide oxidoreductase YuxK
LQTLLTRWKLLYDAECHFCTRFAELVGQFCPDDQIEIISIQDYHRQDPLIPVDDLLAELHLLGDDGALLRGGDAIQKIVSIVPQVGPVRWMATSRWGRRGAHLLYSALHAVTHCSGCRATDRR